MGAAGDPRADPHQGSAVIEAWRGVAAALVMYVHFWAFSAQDWPPLRLAHTGVDLFFVVSGFVFAPYLFGRPLAWRAHAVRRFFTLVVEEKEQQQQQQLLLLLPLLEPPQRARARARLIDLGRRFRRVVALNQEVHGPTTLTRLIGALAHRNNNL